MCNRGALLFAFGALCSCGSEPPEPTKEERLLGSWMVAMPDAHECSIGLTFVEDGTYERDLICELTNGGYGMQVTLGNWYPQGDGRLQLYPTHTSCPGHPPVTYYSYDVTDDSLRVATTEAFWLLERVEDASGGSAAAVFGCFDAAYAFTPMAVRQL